MKEKLTPKEAKKRAIRLQKKDLQKRAKSLVEVLKKEKSTNQNDKDKKHHDKKPFPQKFKQVRENFKPSRVAKRSADDAELGPADEANRQNILKKKRKSTKSNYTLVEDLKKNWNQLRMKSTSNEAKQELIAGMMKKLGGHVVEVALRHDASRIIQSIIQFGSPQQRLAILAELSPKLAEIAKTPYGHFTGLKVRVLLLECYSLMILQAITECNDEVEQKKIAKSLQAHFVSLGCNVIGARTVESILQTFPSHLTHELKAEFYGHVRIIPIDLRILIVLVEIHDIAGPAAEDSASGHHGAANQGVFGAGSHARSHPTLRRQGFIRIRLCSPFTLGICSRVFEEFEEDGRSRWSRH